VPANGGESKRLSGDNRAIAVVFASDRSGAFEIWVCNADGCSPVQLTFLGGHSGTPRWSPDSRRIVFDSNVNGNADVYVVDADGGAPRRITTNPSVGIYPVGRPTGGGSISVPIEPVDPRSGVKRLRVGRRSRSRIRGVGSARISGWQGVVLREDPQRWNGLEGAA
jgi:hypothetical protein